MTDIAEQPRIILASKSPRRKYLLEQAGLSFAVIPSRFDESRIEMTEADACVKTLAEAKALDVAESYPRSWVIGADTVVSIDGRILGKPHSDEEASKMLRRLSGRVHQVFSGYCICCLSAKKQFSDSVNTDVRFKELTDEEIRWYIHTREPFDKAGAYAIQGLGTFLVKSINGSYTNVVGLPVCEVIEILIQQKVVGLNFKDRTKPLLQRDVR